jgi:CRP-like cAMP-binding protein
MSIRRRANRAGNQALSDLAIFAECNERDRERVAALLTAVEVPPGVVLAREGSQRPQFAVIASGFADVVVGTEVVGRLGEGRFFGDSSMLDRGPEVLTVTSATAMHMHVAGVREFATLIAIPSVARGLLRGIAALDRHLHRARAATPMAALTSSDRRVVLAG